MNILVTNAYIIPIKSLDNALVSFVDIVWLQNFFLLRYLYAFPLIRDINFHLNFKFTNHNLNHSR